MLDKSLKTKFGKISRLFFLSEDLGGCTLLSHTKTNPVKNECSFLSINHIGWKSCQRGTALSQHHPTEVQRSELFQQPPCGDFKSTFKTFFVLPCPGTCIKSLKKFKTIKQEKRKHI